MSARPYLTPELFGFLTELKENNDRAWFAAHKARYETHVRDPLCRFVADLAPGLAKISRHFVADPRPTGGSLFRIQRDTRFSTDKTPYKTAAAIHLRHTAGRDVHAPGFYLHLEPGQVFAGAGLWHPERPVLNQIRDALVAHPERWKKSISGKTFKNTMKLVGDSLSRPPQGYDPAHPLIDELKRKDFVAMSELTEDAACAPDFLDRYLEVCRTAAPLVAFLTESIGLPW